MHQTVVIEVLCYFEKHGNDLVISKWINKDWFPLDLEKKYYQLGIHKIEESQLNQLWITFQDESKLQCVVFHKQVDWHFGSEEFIVNQLKVLTHCHSVKMSVKAIEGKSKPDLLYIPLREDRKYNVLFSQFDSICNFIVGNRISKFTFLNGAPINVSTETETVIITDSYVKNLDFLNKIEDLQSLIIERCIVDNWEGLRSLNNLINLRIETADLISTRLIHNLSKLKRLSLVDCKLEEVEGLSDKFNLIFCDLSNNLELESIAPLATSNQLKWLTIENTSIENLDLIHWSELNVLETSNNSISKLTNLDSCQELAFIDYSFTWLTSLSLHEILRLVIEHRLLAYDFCREFNLIDGLY